MRCVFEITANVSKFTYTVRINTVKRYNPQSRRIPIRAGANSISSIELSVYLGQFANG